MKNLNYKILIATIMILSAISSLSAQGYTLTQSQLEKTIKSQIKIQAQKQVDELGGGEVEVKLMNMPYGNIETKEKARVKVESNTNTFLARDIKRVSIYDGETFVKSFPVSVNTLVYKEVLSAINPIVRSQTINVSNSSISKAEIGQYLGKTIDTYPQIDFVAQRNIAKGTPILKDYVKSKPDVIKDTTVNIIFRSNDNLKITVDGKALKEGSIRDSIPVRRLRYNKIYQATVSNKNEVTVRI